jgi:hypothetical protein
VELPVAVAVIAALELLAWGAPRLLAWAFVGAVAFFGAGMLAGLARGRGGR